MTVYTRTTSGSADTDVHQVGRPDAPSLIGTSLFSAEATTADPSHDLGTRWPWVYEHPTILIVDDDDDTRDLVAGFLERDGLTVLQAKDGESALVVIENENVDAVLLDVMMPGLDGLCVCRHIRESPDLRGIGIIMLTALDGLAAELQSISAGADAHITKPVRRTELIDRVRDIV